MNCLQSRRLLLAHPGRLTPELREHTRACRGCARLAHHLICLDDELKRAMRVPVPYTLAEQMLRRERRRRRSTYAAAAIAAGVAFASGFAGVTIANAPGVSRIVHAVGPTHPAVLAIAEVADHTRTAATIEPAAPDDVDEEFRRLGLIAPEGKAHAAYAGKCHLDASSACERVVLTTPHEQASVMLIPEYPAVDRVLVSDQRMVALMAPAGDGAYIIVAASAEAAKRIEKLLVKG